MQRNNSRKSIGMYILVISLTLVVFLSCLAFFSAQFIQSVFGANANNPPLELPVDNLEVVDEDAPIGSISPDDVTDINAELYSGNAILVKVSDRVILMNKNADTLCYPASITKIMTTLIALENIADLSEEIFLPPDIFDSLYAASASQAGFSANEYVSAEDLLYGVILPSGAECCVAIARHVSGSESAYVDLMNEKAKALGMTNTHFVNTTGLHDDQHYTTVKDLAILLLHCLKDDTFRQIFTSSHRYVKPTNIHIQGLTLYSTMHSRLTDFAEDIGGEIIGGKTGYTGEAGLCLASLAVLNDEEYILITTGAKGSTYTEQYNITDAISVYSEIQ